MLSSFKKKLTLHQMYNYLLHGCKEFKKANSKKLDVDRMNRSCNIYAVKNTVNCWKEQFKGKQND